MGDNDVNRLAEQIKNDALAVFIEKAAAAFTELETAVGELPEELEDQWNAILNKLPEVVHSL